MIKIWARRIRSKHRRINRKFFQRNIRWWRGI